MSNQSKSLLNEKERFYAEDYKRILDEGLVGRVMRLVHHSLEKPFRETDSFETTLELGAGHGQHRHFVKHKFTEYIESDIRAHNLPTTPSPYVRRLELDASDLSGLPDSSVDRLVATCLLAHLDNPELALQEWLRVVRNGGVMTIYLPSEPGILLRAARFCFTRPKALRLNLDYDYLVATEHRYSFPFLRATLRAVFLDCEIRFESYPVRRLPWDLSLWQVVQVRVWKSKQP